MDALIAATATTLRVPLVTRDEKLQALPNLQVVW
jgi:predicted nucleic acid-binding protein